MALAERDPQRCRLQHGAVARIDADVPLQGAPNVRREGNSCAGDRRLAPCVAAPQLD